MALLALGAVLGFLGMRYATANGAVRLPKWLAPRSAAEQPGKPRAKAPAASAGAPVGVPAAAPGDADGG